MHEAFYFGRLAPTAVVLWLHGGPHEDVSPRFNPYFHWLNRQGFGVLALEYPGSTGRGALYERRFTPADLRDALQAALDYLWAQHVERVVSWSTSIGRRVQLEMLAGGLEVSAIIDQGGGDPRGLRDEAEQRHLPYLRIPRIAGGPGAIPSSDVEAVLQQVRAVPSDGSGVDVSLAAARSMASWSSIRRTPAMAAIPIVTKGSPKPSSPSRSRRR